MTVNLSPAEQAEADDKLADLVSRGYTVQNHHKNLTAGIRIRHVGQQYPKAYTEGTGNVLAVTARHERDVELVVAYDEPRFEGVSRLTVLADYHVEIVQ